DVDPKAAATALERLHLVPAPDLEAVLLLRLGQVREVERVLAAEVAACVALADQPAGIALGVMEILRPRSERRSRLFLRSGKGHRKRRIERTKATSRGRVVERATLPRFAIVLRVLHRSEK